MNDLDVSRIQQQSYRKGQRDMLAKCIAAVEAALEAGLVSSTDKALYFFEADEDDPTVGYDVTFPKGSIAAALRALEERP